MEFCTPKGLARPLTFDSQAFDLLADVHSPRIIALGIPQRRSDVDIQHVSSISRKVGALSVFDISEISGLIATGHGLSPFEFADVVVTGTQGSLRGPPGALIFCRKAVQVVNVDGQPEGLSKHQTWSLESAIKASVFPRHQGGPHNHSICAVAVALAQCQTPAFKEYQESALGNASALRDRLRQLGYHVGGDGTVYAQMEVDFGDVGPTDLVRMVLDDVGIACDIHHVAASSEVGCGTYAMTSCGLGVHDSHRVADMIHRALQLARDCIESVNIDIPSKVVEGGKITSFTGWGNLTNRMGEHYKLKVRKPRAEVEDWMSSFS